MTQHLTDAVIRRLPTPAKGNKVHYDSGDGKVPGFGARVTSAGARSFVLNYVTKGRARAPHHHRPVPRLEHDRSARQGAGAAPGRRRRR